LPRRPERPVVARPDHQVLAGSVASSLTGQASGLDKRR
jgi:hypothetical protein